MSATAGQREAAGRLLREAEQHVTPIDPLTALLPALDLADAYAVQQDNVTQRLAAGARLVGYKVEPTSAAMHTRPGIDEPAYGHLLDDTLHRDGGTVRTARYCSPRVQPEICFRLARPLRGPGVRALDVLTATEAVAPVLEIVDSRVRDWRITLADTVADNVGSAGLVCGAWTPFERAPISPRSPSTCSSMASTSRRAAERPYWGIRPPQSRGWPTPSPLTARSWRPGT